jgi:hypothetical protein
VGGSGGVLVTWKQHIQPTGRSRVDNNNVSMHF